MPRKDGEKRIVEGFVYQMEHAGEEVNAVKTPSRDWFATGRAMADKVLSLCPDYHKLLHSAAARQQKTVEFYRERQLRGRLEPCVSCQFINVCDEIGYTCPAFRNFVSGKSGGKSWYSKLQLPDKSWDESYPEDDDDA